jgi:hypothetical protein
METEKSAPNFQGSHEFAQLRRCQLSIALGAATINGSLPRVILASEGSWPFHFLK